MSVMLFSGQSSGWKMLSKIIDIRMSKEIFSVDKSYFCSPTSVGSQTVFMTFAGQTVDSPPVPSDIPFSSA